MDKNKYKEIRDKSNFLWLYFLEEGGKRLNETMFNQLLALWIQLTMGTTPRLGTERIIKELDEKHK